MIHYYYGDGKGKTSAAAGAALRAIGNKMNVLFIQFFKDGKSGEITALNRLENIDCIVPDIDYSLFQKIDGEYKNKLKNKYSELADMAFGQSEKYDMIIFDEGIDAYSLGLLPKEDFLKQLNKYKDKKEIILTGHNLVAELVEISDYVSEIKSIKHPFENGQKARRGIEY